MSQPRLSQINVYPVKSVGGLSLSTAWVEKQGLLFDRRFMLAFADGSMVTARKYPNMVKIRSILTPDGIRFSAKDCEPLTVRYADLKMQPTSATVWKDNFEAYTTTDDADDWFSERLGQRVELLFTGEQSQRMREKVGHNVSFADGYPLLIIGQGSLDELNRRSSELHTMDQFRTNLVAGDCEPFAEDSWKRIRIGEVEFEAVKPCERCILTTVDPATGKFRSSKEPLKTLSEFRANEVGGVFFGQNLVAKNEGMICQGDPIEVLEYKDKEIYPDRENEKHSLTCVKREVVSKNFVTFHFDKPQNGSFDYFAGQHLPIEFEADNAKVSRCYTLSSSPTQSQLAISVKRISGGKASNWLHDNLLEGGSLVCRPPAGQFYINCSDSAPILLLSAGSGVTPMMSMLRYLAAKGKLNDVVFYHQCRAVEDIPFRDELNRLEQQHDGLKVIMSLSQPPMDWFGLKGRMTLMHLKQVKDLIQRKVYMCGPEGFMEYSKQLLIGSGVESRHIFQEAFGQPARMARSLKSLSISINGELIKGDNQTTLLEQAEQSGIDIPYRCRAGICGACKVEVESGKVDQPEMPGLDDSQRLAGSALACCSVPLTDVVIRR